MGKIVLRFGLLATALLLLFRISKYSLFTHHLSNELWLGIFAILFLGFGVVISRFFFQRKEGSLPVQQKTDPDLEKVKQLGISKREYEVLQLINEGLSNQEIASHLFISESTVKTHVSNLLVKLDAKRRTQALSVAKELNII